MSKTGVDRYIQILDKNGIVAKVRKSRGQDIDAACGQLANKTGILAEEPSGAAKLS